MISELTHRAVLVQKNSEGVLIAALGAPSVAEAIAVVEAQFLKEDSGKAFVQIAKLFDEKTESPVIIDGVTYEIMDVYDYLDVFGGDDDTE